MTTIVFVFLVLLTTFYSLIFEYLAHKYVLHNYKYFKKAFQNHFKVHHKVSRINNMLDPGYEKIISSHFELISLSLIAIAHLPILFFSTTAYLIILANIIHYYYVHRKSHINTAWGKKNLPWHYAHHMGKNQNLNWGIRSPIIDKILGTSAY